MEEDVRTLKAEYKKLSAELREVENSLKGEVSASKEEEALHAAANGIREYLRKTGGVLLKVTKLSRGLLSLSQGRIVFTNGIDPFPFTAHNAAEVCAEQQGRINYCLGYMSENGVSPRYLAETAKSLHTLYAIYDGEEELAEELRAESAREHKKSRAALEARRDKLLSSLASIDKKLQKLDKSFEERFAASSLKNLSFPKAFAEEPSITLGLNAENRAACTWNLNGGLLYITPAEGGSATPLLKSAILRFLFAFPGACAQILYLCDHTEDDVNSFLDMLQPANVFYGDFRSAESRQSFRMQEVFGSIGDVYRIRTSLLNRNRAASVLSYNKNTPKDVQTPILVILNDYPNGFESCNDVKYLFENGAKYGVYFIVVQGEVNKNRSGDNLPDASLYADISLSGVSDGEFSDGKLKFRHDIPSPDDVDALAASILSVKKSAGTYVSYEDIGFGNFTESFSDVGRKISVNVGKCRNQDFVLDFVTEGDGPKSYAILGGTGNGKSSLMDSLIFNGSMKYSPDDLNFYLIDFKQGASSNEYVKESRMPHVKMVAERSRPEEAGIILSTIINEFNRRQEIFKANNCKSLVAYNALMDRQHKPHLPRIIVIIDETVEMLKDNGDARGVDALIDKCDTLVGQGRSSGIHMVFSFLRIEGKMRNIIDLINGRCCFRCEKEAANNFIKNAGPLMAECTTGVAVVSFDGGDTQDVVKFGYMGKSGGGKYAEKVRAKWSGYPIDTVVIGEDSRYNFKDAVKKPDFYPDLNGAAVGESYYTHKTEHIVLDENSPSLLLLGSDKKVQTDYLTSFALYALKCGATVKLVDGTRLTKTVRERPLYGLFEGNPRVDARLSGEYLPLLSEAYEELLRRMKDPDGVYDPYFFIVHCLQNTAFVTNEVYDPSEEGGEENKEEELDFFGLDNLYTIRNPSPPAANRKKGVKVSGKDTFSEMLKNASAASEFYIIFSFDNPEIFRYNNALQNVKYKIMHTAVDQRMNDVIDSRAPFKAYMEKDFVTENLSLVFTDGELVKKIRHISYDNDEETSKLFWKEADKK